jgi:NhaP-type Na+/H+ or K+/H+ antiporter
VVAVAVYALSLVAAVLISRLAQRTVLSTAVLFLASGFLVGDGALGLVVLTPDDPVVSSPVEIALFAALATLSPGLRRAFEEFGWTLSELIKLAALLVFGALMSPAFLAESPAPGYLFAGLVLFLARPLALAVALFGSGLDWREWIAAAWFGPKGFASVVYGLLILNAGVERADLLFHLIALVTVMSIVAHSSTDVLVARWFRRAEHERGRRRLDAA